MHSLVNAPVLGFDLARSSHGAPLAAILRRCLALGPADLPVLAALHAADHARDDAWCQVGLVTTSAPRLGRVLAAAGQALTGSAGGAAALGVLSAAPLGTLETLLRCVRHDVLDWTWTHSGEVAVQDEVAASATAVVCDAVTAAALGGSLGASAVARLAAPWLDAVWQLPEAAVDVGPCMASVLELLEAAGAADAAAVARLTAVAGRDPAGQDPAGPVLERPGRWAEAMHAASWAVHLAGRVRPAATAQFLLVEAVDRAKMPALALALGAWQVLSGAVQAAVVHDVLDEVTAHRLRAGCCRALDPSAAIPP